MRVVGSWAECFRGLGSDASAFTASDVVGFLRWAWASFDCKLCEGLGPGVQHKGLHNKGTPARTINTRWIVSTIRQTDLELQVVLTLRAM